MDSITKYIESKLLLKVNRKKSKIGRPTEIKYLGFTFYNQFKAKKYKAKAHEKSVQKVVRKLKQLTSRRWGVSNSVKAQKIAEVLRGWINYFKIGSILTVTRKLDTMLRYRFLRFRRSTEAHTAEDPESGAGSRVHRYGRAA